MKQQQEQQHQPVRPESQIDDYVNLEDDEDEKVECVLNVGDKEEEAAAEGEAAPDGAEAAAEVCPPPVPDPSWGKRVPFHRRPPQAPTEDEVREHDLVHVPFRSWCPHCVAAAANI